MIPARSVLAQIAEEDAPHLGPVSALSGFMFPEPPQLAFPASHHAWDEAAAALPELWRDLNARCVLGEELPLLPVDAEALPNEMLWRASMVLGGIAHSYARCELEYLHRPAPVELPVLRNATEVALSIVWGV
jgi:hypothetical protein